MTFINGTEVGGNAALLPNTWYHLVATYDGSSVKFYVNGQFQNSADKSDLIDTSTGNLYIGDYGGSLGSSAYNFKGIIDEVRIYNRALSEEEIKAHYLANKDNYPSWSKVDNTSEITKHTVPASYYYDGGAVGIWKFDEGSGSTAFDSSRSGNIGTLYDANTSNSDGNTPPQWVSGKYGKALEFDGIDDYVEVADSSSLQPTEFSVELWFRRFNNDTNYEGIITKWEQSGYYGFIIQSMPDGSVRAVLGAGDENEPCLASLPRASLSSLSSE